MILFYFISWLEGCEGWWGIWEAHVSLQGVILYCCPHKNTFNTSMKSYKAINSLIEPILQITLGTPHLISPHTNILILQNVALVERLGERGEFQKTSQNHIDDISWHWYHWALSSSVQIIIEQRCPQKYQGLVKNSYNWVELTLSNKCLFLFVVGTPTPSPHIIVTQYTVTDLDWSGSFSAHLLSRHSFSSVSTFQSDRDGLHFLESSSCSSLNHGDLSMKKCDKWRN